MPEHRRFNGERLRMARAYRGLTSTEFAGKLGVTKQAVYQLESGKNSPRFETLLQIANLLDFPREFFYQWDRREIPRTANTFFRAQLTTHKTEQISQMEKIKILARIHIFLRNYVDLPSLNIPEFHFVDGEFDVEDIANDVKKSWYIGDGPIPNMVRLLERNGFIVTSLPVGSSRIDAFSMGYEANGQPEYYIVLGSDKDSAVRRQFDAAHELGHCVLHNWTTNGDEGGRAEIRERESEANRFAAAFLMPKESFLADLIYPNKLDFYVSLKKRWKVSIASMIVRAFHLGAINANQYHYLMRQLTRRGWRHREPLDDELKVDQPVILRKALDLILSSGTLMPSQFVKQLSEEEYLSLSRREIEILLGLPGGTLFDEFQETPIIQLREASD